ncbi:cytochrome P450 [Calothrix sp. HK-06]|nr:cytochrome P450 [Calothrix sp. HK-06]
MTQLKSADQMPGNFGLPFFGEAIEIVTTQGWGLAKNYQRYGAIFKTSLLGRKYAVLVGAEANKVILHLQADRVSSYMGWQPFMEQVFGRPMMLQDGDTHRFTRRLMAPAFHSQAIASYFETMQQVINECLDNWKIHKTVPLKSEFNQLALRVGIRLLLGIELVSDIEQIEKWYKTLIKGASAILRIDLPFMTYGRSKIARRQLKAFFGNIISERKQQGNLQESKDVLGLFLASVDGTSSTLSDNQIIDELIHLINGAHFTTSTSLTWSLVELAAHPELQAKLRQELQQVTGGSPLCLEHLKKLNQMNYFLKEIERVYNPAGVFLFRGVVKEIEYAGYSIPPGWNIILAQGLTHQLPSLYTNPENFDPQRFAPPREEDKKEPFGLIGFGGGEHTCIGMEFAKMEIKIVLTKLLSQYKWTIEPKYTKISPISTPPKVENKLRALMEPL